MGMECESTMVKIIVVGGGWAGCAAAIGARKTGADVTLLERTDMVLGTGLVGGIYRNNGRFTAAEEAIAMGGGELFKAMDDNARHVNIDFPGHMHASLYDVRLIEPIIKEILLDYGIEVRMQTRAMDVQKYGRKVFSVLSDTGEVIKGDAFIDTSGTAGPMGNCLKYGNGCAMCVLRCPSYGPRVSIAQKAGVKEITGCKEDGTYGAMSGSCKLSKSSLSTTLCRELETKGKVVLELPPALQKKSHLGKKACSQYAVAEYAENLVLLDTGHVKMMTPYFPLHDLRTIPGLENAKYEDPYSGSIGNSMRYLGIAKCDDMLKVDGIDNLFCAGEKSANIVGHTEAITTGLLAGHNAVRCCLDMKYLEIPKSLASGDLIAFSHEQADKGENLNVRYTFSGSVYFQRMKEKDLYLTNRDTIAQRVADAGLSEIYSCCLI